MSTNKAVNAWMLANGWAWLDNKEDLNGIWYKEPFVLINQNTAAEMYRMSEARAADATGRSFAVGDMVKNTSGWGVGANSELPLTITKIILEVTWDGARSNRWLKPSEVEKLATTNPRKEG